MSLEEPGLDLHGEQRGSKEGPRRKGVGPKFACREDRLVRREERQEGWRGARTPRGLHPSKVSLTPFQTVDISNAQTCREFPWVYLSQTDDRCHGARFQWREEAPQRRAVLLILYIRMTGGGAGRAGEAHSW